MSETISPSAMELRKGEQSRITRYTSKYQILVLGVPNLCNALTQIEENETNYAEREKLVWEALVIAKHLGYKAGVRFDPAEPTWPVVAIELPGVGEVSWHCPAYDAAYTGYSVAEKYARTKAFVATARAAELVELDAMWAKSESVATKADSDDDMPPLVDAVQISKVMSVESATFTAKNGKRLFGVMDSDNPSAEADSDDSDDDMPPLERFNNETKRWEIDTPPLVNVVDSKKQLGEIYSDDEMPPLTSLAEWDPLI